jgi:hypothetical protein
MPGRVNTGVAVFGAPDEAAAQQVMAADPATSSGTPGGIAPVPGLVAPRPGLTRAAVSSP